MDDAGRKGVAAGVDAPLVEGEPGHEPRGLQAEDGGDGHGAREAEGLKAGQDLEDRVSERNFNLDLSVFSSGLFNL